MIFSDAGCTADRPSVGLSVGKMFFGRQRLVVVVLHIWDVAILKETCRGRTERGSNEAKCEYFPEIEDPLVPYLRKRTRLLNAIHLSFGKSVSIFEEGHLPKIKLHDS